jgi:aspartate oxidase
VVKAINKHIDQWSSRRWALGAIDDERAMTIKVLRVREEAMRKEAYEREVREATSEAKRAIQTTQRVAQEIEATKAKLATLMQEHRGAERRESELMRALRKLTMTPEEVEAAEAQAAAKSNGGAPRLM